MKNNKFVTKQEFNDVIRPSLKAQNKTIALSHGVFDLVHPGHIIHFEKAKKYADVLVVSITDSLFVRKGPGRPYFNNDQRVNYLSALEYVDYVMISNGYTVDDIVECVKPDFYVKGSEYKKESDDVTEMIAHERELVESFGGKVEYTDGDVFSSTRLINNALGGLSPEIIQYMSLYKQTHSLQSIKHFSDLIKELKILVIGDIIVDRYTYCDIQGLISKDMAYSARSKYTEDYLGGAAAIARHLSDFCDSVSLMSVVGNDGFRDKYHEQLSSNINLDIYESDIIPTIVKHRFLTSNAKREEYHKVFAINNIVDDKNYEQTLIDKFVYDLEKNIKKFDVVFLCDFGHGFVGKDIMRIVQDDARYLVLNCQTNSTNKGRNIITKYHRADAFSLDQNELMIAYPSVVFNEKKALLKLKDRLNGVGWLTRGALGAYGVDDNASYECPAFTLQVRDTIGAGDAFFAIAGAYSAVGADTETCMVMGNIAGALGANIIGNKDTIQKSNVLKYASTLLNV